MKSSSRSTGIPTSQVEIDAAAVGVQTDDDTLRVLLADGREIVAPLVWFPILLNATPEQRANWRLIGHDTGIGWGDIDEHISIAGLLRQS
jgi:hypothetical protein